MSDKLLNLTCRRNAIIAVWIEDGCPSDEFWVFLLFEAGEPKYFGPYTYEEAKELLDKLELDMTLTCVLKG